MKRAAILLLSGLLVLQLAACGNEEAPPVEEETTESASESEQESSEEERQAEPEPEPEPEPEEPSASEPDVPPEPASQAAPPVNQEPSSQAAEVSAAAAASTGNPFALDPNGDYEMYAYDPANMMYSSLGGILGRSSHETALANGEDWALLVDAVNKLPTLSATTSGGNPVSGFMTLDEQNNYKKVQYLLLPGNVLEVDGVAYSVPQKQYDNLLSLCRAAFNRGDKRAQWLVYMNPNRVTQMQSHDANGNMQVVDANVVLAAAMEPRYITVSSCTTYTPSGASLDGWYQVVYTFDSGVQYLVAVKDSKMRVQYSDMSFGCEYEVDPRHVDSFIQYSIEAQQGRANPRTGKPVIYLYPETTQDVEVKLDFQGKLYYTFPTYENGWRVTARPDGTLTNKADGSTHFYLFWDGTAEKDTWDFSSGFLVEGSETESFLREKLPLLGLTPREYNDFIVYWVPEMMKNPYNLITFSTTEYEQVAPLTITPAPDTVLRVHMIYTPMYEKVEIKEQILPAPPARNGFTVVEWGGTRA